MKKNKKQMVFPILYEIVTYIYIVFMFLYPAITKYNKSNDIFTTPIKMMKFSIIICIITFLLFIIDMILNKSKFLQLIKRKEIILLILFIFWCFISTILSNNFHDSMYGINYRYSGFIQFLSYSMFLILGYSLSEKGRSRYFRVFIIISVLIGITDPFINSNLFHNGIFVGIFYNLNHYGYYLVYSVVISIFLFINDKNIIIKVIDYFIFLFLLYYLIINNTFGCYIAILFILIILFIYLLKKKKVIIYIPIILAFTFLSLTTMKNQRYIVIDNFQELFNDLHIITTNAVDNNEQNSINHTNDQKKPIDAVGNYRGSLWKLGIKYIKEKPLFGYGLDNLYYRYLEDFTTIDDPHNLIINLAAEIGIPGMLFYIIGIITILIKGFKKAISNDHMTNICYFVVLSHLISAMFGITIYYVTPYYVIILGMAIKLLDEEKNYQD